MPEVQIEIGGRSFEVSCQEGEEHYLQAAAKMLDEEASVLAAQIGRIPEARMLLMAGLMLADKTAGMQDKLREMEDQLAEAQSEAARLRDAPAPEAQRIEVPVMPAGVSDAMAEMAARAEALADKVDAKAQKAG
ncbi:cell division protein ZapA [Roseovarius sp. C7]|uniref:cell division protein ZapA n=1 Tax=Roseovarius sp. C7 TaxID=3398643 RepID=UPI0039F55D91